MVGTCSNLFYILYLSSYPSSFPFALVDKNFPLYLYPISYRYFRSKFLDFFRVLDKLKKFVILYLSLRTQKEKEANMAMTIPVAHDFPCKTNSRVTRPTHLTVKDLLEKDACEPGFQKFVARFGKSINLKDNALKEWFEQNPYKSWLQNNLPDHYVVIFPEPTLEVNDYAFIEDCPNDICRIYDIIDERIMVIFHDGKVIGYDKYGIKPISERPFQVGDWVVLTNEYNGQKQIMQLETQEQVRYANARKRWQLIISPAIPEVK